MIREILAAAALTSLAITAPTSPQGKGGGGGGGGSTPPPDPAIAFVDGGIKVMNEDGTNKKLVVPLANGLTDARYPSWSPDNSELVFWGVRNGVAGIYRHGLNGSGPTFVTSARAIAADWSPQPTVDGNHKIAFSDGPSSGGSGRTDLWIVNPDGSDRVNLTSTPDYAETNPAWMNDGRLAYNRVSTFTGFYVEELVVCELGLVDDQVAIVLESIVENTQTFHFDLTAAQTQSTLVYTDSHRIYVLDEGGAPRLLTLRDRGTEQWPSFSPDDSKLSFARSGGGKQEVFTVQADGSGEKRISTKGSQPRWRR